MSYFELANMVHDLLELIANYSRDPSDENWDLIIRQSIQIDSKIEMSYPQESETRNGRIPKQ
jgi:hypothetical protein